MSQRQGLQEFRRCIFAAYEEQCAGTCCREPATLQAANIRPVTARDAHHISISLLLPADVQNLLDLGLIAIDEKRRILVASTVTGRAYRELDGNKARMPSKQGAPSRSALGWHYKRSTNIDLSAWYSEFV